MLSRGLMSACQKKQAGLSTEQAKALMKQLTEGLRTHFGHAETNPLYAHATFLDPRFKKASLMRAYMHRTWSLPTTACYSR